jgi:hypothetical protein
MAVDAGGYEKPFGEQRRDVEPASEAVSCKKKLEDVLKERNGLRSQIKS